MSKKRVLIAHPRVVPSGGGDAVAAWALQALRDDFEVSLATLVPVDYAGLNQRFGTSLRAGDFQVHLAPPRYARFLRSVPTPGALLEICLTMRLAQNLDRENRYDVLLSTNNEFDFGRRGIQYVHYPWVYLPRPEIEMRWYHFIPGLLDGYRALCRRVARSSNAGLRRNLTLANSRFIAGLIREVHAIDSLIVYPPVLGGFPDVPWEQRQRGFVSIGRIHPCKRWDMAVDILDEVRRRGHDATFTLFGIADDPAYYAKLMALSAARPWFRLRVDAGRDELAAAIPHYRYGLHTMKEEHFGIAPAELHRAGCIVFVHNSGGPIEIVNGDPRVLFETVHEAAEKIERVLTGSALENELRADVLAQRDRFSVEAFSARLRELVDRLDSTFA